MGVQVPSPVETAELPPYICSGDPAAATGLGQPDGPLGLPSAAGLAEIEEAHTPLPHKGSARSSTGEEVTRTPRRDRSGLSLVTLKRKGSDDIVRETHVRSSSQGSVESTRMTPPPWEAIDNTRGEGIDGDKVYPSIAVYDPSPSTEPSRSPTATRLGVLDSSTASGGSHGKRASWGRSTSAIDDAAQRIAVDPDAGHSYFVERPTVCDACPYCEDVCEVDWCNDCDERRGQLEYSYGPLMLSMSDLHLGASDDGSRTAAAGMDRIRRVNSRGKMLMAPVLSRRYPRKGTFTLCEVRRRKVTGACWVVCKGSVYDVTGALENHPGGKRSVLRNAGGRDCAEDFFFHSKAAKKQWRQYRIGSIIPCAGEKGNDGDNDDERVSRTGSDCVIS